jgi:hypothetical protein
MEPPSAATASNISSESSHTMKIESSLSRAVLRLLEGRLREGSLSVIGSFYFRRFEPRLEVTPIGVASEAGVLKQYVSRAECVNKCLEKAWGTQSC